MKHHSSETREVVRHVKNGTSIDLVGVRSSGRSTVLRQARSSLENAGTSVLAVSGAGPGLPLEALRIALPPAYRDAAAKAGTTPAALSDAIARYLSDGAGVTLVDDSDLLDEQSWAVLVHVHRTIGRPLVSSTLRCAPGTSRRRLSTVVTPVAQVALGELRLDALHAVLEERVDGSLSPAVSAHIHMKSAGVPGLALALLDKALAHDLVHRSGNLWVSGTVLWSDDMHSIYESLLVSFRPQVRDAVELLALTGGLELSTAWALVGTEVLEELEGDQLVRLTEMGSDRRPVVAVHPPGLEDHFLAQPPSARRGRVVEQATSRLTSTGSEVSREERVKVLARLRPVDPQGPGRPAGKEQLESSDVPVISRVFTDSYEIDLRALRARWTTEADVLSAADYLAHRLTGPHDPHEIDALVSAAAESFYGSGGDPGGELALRHLHSRWLLSQGATVDEALVPLRDRVSTDFEHVEALHTLTLALRWELDALDPAYADLLEPRSLGTGLDAEVAGLVLAACHVMSGRAAAALVVLDRIGDDIPRLQRVAAELIRGLALYSTGRFAEVADRATRRAQEAISAVDRVAFAVHSYLGALAQLALGHLDEARDALAVVLSAGISSRPIHFTPDRASLVLMSVLSNRTGHEAAASGFRDHAQEVLGTSDAVLLGPTAWAEAFSVASSGETGVAASIFATLVEDARRRGYLLAADSATMASLVIHYDPHQADHFKERAELLGGTMFTAYLDVRAAAHDHDPRRVEESARLLRQHGAESEALKYFTLAARLYTDQQAPESAASVRAEARAIIDTVGAREASRSRTRKIPFTRRERQVILLVSRGRSNADIAHELVVSVRTVENHLRNIRRKSGATERTEIAGFAESHL